MNVTYLKYKPGNPLFGPNHKEIIEKFFNDVDKQMLNPQEEIFKSALTNDKIDTLVFGLKHLGVTNPNELLSPWTRPADIRVEGFIHDNRDDQFDEEQYAVSLYFHQNDELKSRGMVITFANIVSSEKWVIRSVKISPTIIGTYPLSNIDFNLNFHSPGLNMIEVIHCQYTDPEYIDSSLSWADRVRNESEYPFNTDYIRQNLMNIISREKKDEAPDQQDT